MGQKNQVSNHGTLPRRKDQGPTGTSKKSPSTHAPSPHGHAHTNRTNVRSQTRLMIVLLVRTGYDFLAEALILVWGRKDAVRS